MIDNKHVQKVFDYCNNKSETVFTGSRAIGVGTKNSDWDFVMCVSEYDMYKFPYILANHFDGKILEGGEYSLFESNQRIVIEICPNKWFFGLFKGDTVIHVIIEREEEGLPILTFWKVATNYCRENPDKCKNKLDRLNIFSYFGVKQGYENLFLSNNSFY
jgi:hypothetical protein